MVHFWQVSLAGPVALFFFHIVQCSPLVSVIGSKFYDENGSQMFIKGIFSLRTWDGYKVVTFARRSLSEV